MLERPSDYLWYIQIGYKGGKTLAQYKGDDVHAAKKCRDNAAANDNVAFINSYYHGRLVQVVDRTVRR
jgi:hypothetical protein